MKYPVAVGFPFAQDITDHEAFADLCGFTSAELQNVVQTTMTDKTLPVTDDELVNRMKNAYSGYRFSPSSDTLVVNPEACIHYLCYWYHRNCEATPVKPQSIRTQEDIMDAMFHLGYTASVSQIVSSLVQGIPLPAPAATAPVGSENRSQLSDNERLDLLRCMGFLTYSATASELVIPNKYMTEGFDLYFLRRIAGFSSFIISDRRAKEVAQALTKGDIRPLFERITEPLRNEADHAPSQYSDEFILRTAVRVLINLCTDYRWVELGTTGFGLLPVAGNTPAYAVGIATINAEENTAEMVAQKLDAVQTKLKRAAALHPLNTDTQIIHTTVAFTDFEVAAMKID